LPPPSRGQLHDRPAGGPTAPSLQRAFCLPHIATAVDFFRLECSGRTPTTRSPLCPLLPRSSHRPPSTRASFSVAPEWPVASLELGPYQSLRSEERRVGNECTS